MDRKPGHLSKDVKQAVNSIQWIKVVGVGNASSGKTCLIKHFCESKFAPGYQPTVGVDYGFKIQDINGTDLRVHLWDLSGSSEYMDVRNELYVGSDAVFLVCDVTCQSSYESLDSWLREVNKFASRGPEIILVANKIDLKQKRCVSPTDCKKWATLHKVRYYETSAATGEGVEQLFSDLLTAIVARRKTGPHSGKTVHKSDAKSREPQVDLKWNSKLVMELHSVGERSAKSAKH